MLSRYLPVLLFLPFISCSQGSKPKSRTSWYRVGNDSVSVTVTDYGGKGRPVYINLHDDESTSLQAALPLIRRDGGTLVKINNRGERNIKFTIDSAEYIFDPNRIFSRIGIVHSLVRHKRISNKAIDEIEGFARFFINQVPAKASFIIALHNNINGSLSVDSYLEGGQEAANAAAVSKVKYADTDDFMLTTQRETFNYFQGKFNIILQDNERARQDGSLSVYFAAKGIPYLNCETEHGHERQFARMLDSVHHWLSVKQGKPRESFNP